MSMSSLDDCGRPRGLPLAFAGFFAASLFHPAFSLHRVSSTDSSDLVRHHRSSSLKCHPSLVQSLPLALFPSPAFLENLNKQYTTCKDTMKHEMKWATHATNRRCWLTGSNWSRLGRTSEQGDRLHRTVCLERAARGAAHGFSVSRN